MAACTATPAGTPTASTPAASTPAASTPAGTPAASSAAPSTTVQPSPSASPSQSPSPSPSPSPSSSEPPQIASALTVSPAQIETAIGKVDGLADTIMRKSGIPGMAVAVVQGGRTAFAKGYGVRKVGEPARVDADTVFQLASLSKSVGSTVVAHEVAAGTLDWSTPVTANLPDFTLSDPYVTKTVTVGDMYAHRSGLPAEAGDILETLGFSQEQILQRLRYQKLNPFRISYGYANYGITSGAESVAAAAGKDWPTLSQDDLYTPLGMTSTSSRFRDYVSRSDRAWTHVPVNGKWTPRYVRDADPQSPAGGVSSSVDDLAKWMVMVLHEGTGANGAKITTPAALTPAVTAQIVASPAQVPAARSGFYGFGFDVTTEGSGRVEISHSGAFSAGAGTNYVLIPSLDLGIVTVTNALPIGVAEALNQEFADLVQYGEPRTDWYDVYRQALGQLVAPTGRYVGKQPPTDPKPAGPAAAYVGIYRNDYYGYLRIEGNDGELRLVLGPAQVTYSLRHWDAGVYVFEPTGEGQNAGSVSAANFTRSGSAGASAVTVEYLDDDGLGTFERVPGTR